MASTYEDMIVSINGETKVVRVALELLKNARLTSYLIEVVKYIAKIKL